MPEEPSPPTVLIRGSEVARRVGRNMTTIWAWIKRGDNDFPLPVVLNPGQRREIIAFKESEIDQWIASRPQRLAQRIGGRQARLRRPG